MRAHLGRDPLIAKEAHPLGSLGGVHEQGVNYAAQHTQAETAGARQALRGANNSPNGGTIAPLKAANL